MKNIRLSGVFIILFLLAGVWLHAQPGDKGFTLSGKIINGSNGKPVDVAVVFIPELNLKIRTGEGGSYSLRVPAAGTYSIMINSPGLKLLRTSVEIKNDLNRDFKLLLPVEKGAILVIGERDIQKISRYTMTAKQMKTVPASFGDSVSALTSLPGVIRTGGGFFGPLVIRGADPSYNKYYIDDIPINNPQHFGGIHSVISSDLMSEIDLYSSAFPAQFGAATGAVLNINTLDNVEKFSGNTEFGMISANVLIKTPITKKEPDGKDGEIDKNIGYFIVAGRYGYLSLLVPPVYHLITGDSVDYLPDYWDYQVKGKYFLNSRNSITLFFMGSRDYWKFFNKITPTDEIDPVLKDFQFKTDLMTHSQAIYYTYQPNDRFKNTLMGYSSLTESYNYMNIDNESAADWMKDIHISSRPYIFGLKDKIKWEYWEKKSELRLGADCTYYFFKADGKSILPTRTINGQPDWSDPDLFEKVDVYTRTINMTVGAYAENKFTFGGLVIVPGVRTDYLDRTRQQTVDPRGMMSYEFRTDTTISAAAGRYSYFLQTNPNYFNYNPNLSAIGKGVKPERALHRSLSIEQKVELYTFKAEGFYNNFYDLAVADPHYDENGDLLLGRSSGKSRNYGIELMIRKDRIDENKGLFGWINYTYTQAKYKSGVPVYYDSVYNRTAGDPYGDIYINFPYEQEHALKLVAGYTFFESHTVSAKFQLYTSMPYSPVTGSYKSPEVTPAGQKERWLPIRGGKPYSAHNPVTHELDLRYTHKTSHEWGNISWYVEIINVYNQRTTEEIWNYTKPYEPGVNPRRGVRSGGLSMIPNFGVEVKF